MDRGPKFWSALIGSIPGLLGGAIAAPPWKTPTLEGILTVFTFFLWSASITAVVWWLLIERKQQLHYIRAILVVPSVLIISFFVFTVIHVIREEGIHFQIPELVDALGTMADVLILWLLATAPGTLLLGFGLMLLRRFLDSNYSIDPRSDPESAQ